MVFDNTYCNPNFKFPKIEDVFIRMRDIILKNKEKHVYICMGALGKEDLCIKLSTYFNTKLIIAANKVF